MSDTIARLNAALEGRYAVERELGEGGMATVYLAHDVRHDRPVAVKVLKPELAAVLGAERFLGEIKTTANLQHPHILPLFDSGEADGFLFYVMPFIDGETLQEKLDREKQLPVDEAITIATKIAGALQAAHDRGVIHRDIKPANILLSGGEPLVADFGIALAVSAAGGGRMTETGLSLGTPFYMSPEQATADRDPDARSDVYSLGCVLYEMLTGEPPHMGGTAQAVLARILTDTPRPVSERRSSVPRNVGAAIATALEKLPADRFPSAAAFSRALADETYETRTGAGAAAEAPGHMRARSRGIASLVPWAIAGVLGVVAAVSWLRSDPTPLVQRYQLALDNLGYGGGTSLAISPDGSTIAYMGSDVRLYVRAISALEPQLVPGSEESRSPFFSPDGRSIGYTVGPAANDEIRTMSLDGAPPRTLSGDHFPGGSWGDDGFIYYVDITGDMLRVSEQGGEPEILADSTSEYRFRFPQPLPGGRAVLAGTNSDDGPVVAVFDLETHDVTPLLAGSNPRYVRGYMFWVDGEGTLFAAPFDLDRLELSGQAMELADRVRPSLQGSYDYAVADNGTLIYSQGGDQGPGGETIGWADRNGGTSIIDTRLASQFGDIDNLALSPDGRFVALEVADDMAAVEEAPAQIWIYDLEQSIPTRLTFRGGRNAHPRWLPDGRVAYLSNQGDGSTSLWAQPYDRSGSDELLFEAGWPISGFDVATDRGFPLILSDNGPTFDLWLTTAAGDAAAPFLATPYLDSGPRLSSDGRWVAYESDETGRREVYIRAFPRGGRPWPISREGGFAPVWSRSGDELFYIQSLTTGREVMVAALEFGDEVRVTSTTRLFSGFGMDLAGMTGGSARYDVSRDGEKLLVILDPDAGGSPVAGSSEGIVLVLNVFEELDARRAN